MNATDASPEGRLEEWIRAQNALFAFLDSVEADDNAFTITLRLLARPIDSPQQFADELGPKVRSDGTWAFVTTSGGDGGQRYALAMPVAEWSPASAFLFPFVEIHTLLVAWWLTTAWRVRQLSRAGLTLFSKGETVAAAACVRPLVETAAASWVDGSKLARAWDEIKRAGRPENDGDALSRRMEMMKQLNQVLLGARFDDRAPESLRAWKFERRNVLGYVDKLSNLLGGDLQEDYQWLCNTVHPSVGNSLAFSAPPFLHETSTHLMTWLAGRPIHVEGHGEVVSEDTVETATTRSASDALGAIRTALDATLHAIDDVALTTRAPMFARFEYWRNIREPERNAPCPCRSGAKSKRCRHEWGDRAPSFPTTLSRAMS